MDFEQKYQKDPGMNRVKSFPFFLSFLLLQIMIQAPGNTEHKKTRRTRIPDL